MLDSVVRIEEKIKGKKNIPVLFDSGMFNL